VLFCCCLCWFCLCSCNVEDVAHVGAAVGSDDPATASELAPPAVPSLVDLELLGRERPQSSDYLNALSLGRQEAGLEQQKEAVAAAVQVLGEQVSKQMACKPEFSDARLDKWYRWADGGVAEVDVAVTGDAMKPFPSGGSQYTVMASKIHSRGDPTLCATDSSPKRLFLAGMMRGEQEVARTSN